MQDWRLLAIIGFSAAGALVLLLLMVTIIFNRRRRCTHMHYSAKVLQLEDSLKAVQVEKEVQDETCCSLRRSVEDFDAERSLLMKRLESCDRNSTSEELRQCTRETQLYLAIQAANSRQWRRAVDADRKDGPPALLAEAWLVHGELYRPRDESSYPNLDDLPPVFSQSRGSFHGTRRAGSGCLTSSTSADSVPVRDATGPPSLRRFHSCAVHNAAPGLSRRRQRHPVVCPGPSDFSHTEAVTTTQTLPASTAGGCCEDESMTITESGANETEDGGYRGSVSHTTTDSETCGGSCGDEKTVRVTSPLTGCTTTGTQPDTSVEVDSSSCRADCCTESKPCCGTVVIPAHTFAPEYVFLGEQWLPGPYEAAKTCVHEIPLVRLAKSSRMDHMKADGLDTDLYRKILPEAHKLEKAVIFSGCPRQVDLGSTRDRIRLQSHALIDLLPSLRVSTKSMEFPHLCYSLIEYQLQKLTAISKSALRGYVGDALNQPLYLLLRVFECKSVILASPPVSPANREASVLASEEEQDRWEMLYEAPPVCVVDAEGRFVDDGSIVFDEDSAFQYKHPFTPKPSKLLETADQVPPDCNPPVRSGCPSGLHIPEPRNHLPAQYGSFQHAYPPQGQPQVCHYACHFGMTELECSPAQRDQCSFVLRKGGLDDLQECNGRLDVAFIPSAPHDGAVPMCLRPEAPLPMGPHRVEAPNVDIVGDTGTFSPRPEGNAAVVVKRADGERRLHSRVHLARSGSAPTGRTLSRETHPVEARKPRPVASTTCAMHGSRCRAEELGRSSETGLQQTRRSSSSNRSCPRPPWENGVSPARSSAEADERADSAETATRFKDVCLSQQGLLFKDNVLSVSCVVGTTAFPERNAFHASIELSVVNRGSSGIESLSEETALQAGFHSVHATVENVEQEALACSVSPFVRAPPAGSRTPGRVIQTISATIMQPFQVVPEVTLEVVLPDGAEHRCTFALPLIVTQFMKPLTLLPAAFMQLWFDGSLHSRLMSVRISSRLMAAGPEELLRVVTFNGKFKASNGIKHRLAEGSIFAIGELAAIGDMVTDCKCLVRLSQAQCGALAMAKLETKAQDRRVAAAVFELLAYLLEDAE